MEIDKYIESGVIESYLLGSASDKEIEELMHLKERFPQVALAMEEIEADISHITMNLGVPPPPSTFNKIEDRVNELIQTPFSPYPDGRSKDRRSNTNSRENYIEVEGNSSHMRVHKIWRWLFLIVFLLGKIFLAFAIYFYLESRQYEQRVQELKQELLRMEQK